MNQLVVFTGRAPNRHKPWPSGKEPDRPFDHLFYARGVGWEQHRDDAEFIFQHRAFMRKGAEAIKPMRVAEPRVTDATIR